jgi:cystathionine beta-synthase
VQVWAIDSYGSLLKKWFDTGELDMGEVHPYISEGFGEDFLPENYDRNAIDHFEKVTDKDGAVMARRITREEGIFVGYSAGSVVAGLRQLKDKLKKDDVVVLIFHDHGTRYVGKVYNDEWMLDRGFLEVDTVGDLINGLGRRRLVTIPHDSQVISALEMMKKYDIEHIPVLNGLELVGTVSQGSLFRKLIEETDVKQQLVSEVMDAPLPLVDRATPLERLTHYINKDNGAVLTKDESGQYSILTKYDILNAFSKG